MTKKYSAIILPIVVIALVAVVAFARQSSGEELTFHTNSGLVFGTSYNIKYEYTEDLHEEIQTVLDSVDNSLSPFNEKSIITAVNNNKDVELNDKFIEVFNLAQQVSRATDGAFDITVAPLVNVWGFGFKHGKFPTANDIDSIKAFVGYQKVRLSNVDNNANINDNVDKKVNVKVIKDDPRLMLDCSAIAKGYAVDKVAQMLQRKGIENFLVEIGGEIVAKGHNPQNKTWKIGVQKPDDDSLSVTQNLQTVLELTDMAMATSGDYRNFYVKDGKKYAHTINPHTGYPAEQNILSATVVAPTCAEADAFATAFMTMGLSKAQTFVKEYKGLNGSNGFMVYFIYHNPKDGKYAIWQYGSLNKSKKTKAYRVKETKSVSEDNIWL